MYKQFDYETLVLDHCLPLRDSKPAPEEPSRVVLLHFWNKKLERIQEAIRRYDNLAELLPEYTHIAVHLDLGNDRSTPEYFERSPAVKSKHIISMVDNHLQMMRIWKTSEISLLPCTLIIVDGHVRYVGHSHHRCSIQYFPQLIEHLLSHVPKILNSSPTPMDQMTAAEMLVQVATGDRPVKRMK
jgi:hypothetical protein